MFYFSYKPKSLPKTSQWLYYTIKYAPYVYLNLLVEQGLLLGDGLHLPSPQGATHCLQPQQT